MNRRAALTTALLALAASLALAPTAASAATPPPELWKSCPSGLGAGQCDQPRGIGVDPNAPGHLYVADQSRDRIVELSAWGEFRKAWGWGVANGAKELQSCGPAASPPTAACFEEHSRGAGAGQFNTPMGVAVDSSGDVYVVDWNNRRVQKFDSEGNFLLMFGGGVISGGATGTGTVTSGQASVTSVLTTSKAFQVGQAITGTGIEAGTTIAAVGSGTITLSKAAGPAATGATTALTAPEGSGNVPTNEKQVLTLGANTTGGTFALTFTTPEPSSTSAQAAAIPASASAAELEAELSGLPNVGAGNVEVKGAAGGPWTIEFKGARFADTDVALVAADPSGLTVGSGEKSATATTAVQGAGAGELCSVAVDCRAGIASGTEPANGQFGSWPVGSLIAVDTNGTETDADDTIYVGDTDRIQKFDTAGHYTGQVSLPEAGAVQSLAVDQKTGDLYFAGPNEQPNVLRLDPSTGSVLDTLEVEKPTALATDAEGNVYVFSQGTFVSGSINIGAALRKFNPSGDFVETIAQNPDFTSHDEFAFSTGIATGSVCLAKGSDLYLANATQVDPFVRAWGAPPDKAECPPEQRAPDIDAQYAVSVGTEEATLRAQVNPHFWSGSQGETTYYAQYATTACIEAEGWAGACVKAQPAPPGAELEAGLVGVDVGGDVSLSGLAPNTAYRYRFAAEATDSKGKSVLAGQPVFGKGGKPGEPGTAGAFTTFPEPGEPNTKCINQALRVGASAALPDCRAYEMVSPLDKEGGDVALGPAERLDQSATSGNKLTYTAGPSPYTQHVASRQAGGWASENISPPSEGGAFDLASKGPFAAFSADLSEGWLRTATEPVLAAGGVAGFDNLYRRDNADGTYEACTTAKPPNAEAVQYAPEVQGASADASHRAVFAAADQLAPGAAPSGGALGHKRQLYECHEGQLSVVSVLPNGSASKLWNTVGTASGTAGPSGTATLAGAVSANASRVYWTATSGESGPGALYLRKNPDQAQSAQLHGSAVGTGNLIGTGTATGKVSKGLKTLSEVLVTSGEFAVGQTITGAGIPAGTTITAVETEAGKLKISNAATVGGEGVELTGVASKTVSGVTATSGAFAVGQSIAGAGIAPGTTIAAVAGSTLTLSANATQTGTGVTLEGFSQCTEAAKACTLAVSPGASARFWAARPDGSQALFSEGEDLYRFDAGEAKATQIAAKVKGVLGASQDLSRVYLISAEDLGGEAQAGQPNLYLYEGGAFSFVATLSASDSSQEGLSPVNPRPGLHSARVNPSGSHLAFMSDDGALSESVAGYDNTDLASGEPDAEIYLYEAASKEIHCFSCNRSGSRPAGRETGGLWAAAMLPTPETSLYATRALADDGARLFFESFEPLVLADTNGKADVYQWEAPGTGDCEEGKGAFSPPNGGCVTLISSGQSPADSEFIDASPDGSNVFIATGESLLSEDPGQADLYDARVGGGFGSPGEEFTLTVTVTGNGSVSASEGTISGCTSSGGPSCEGEYGDGAKVLLTETPGAHSRFAGWGTLQCDESTAMTCEVEVSADEGVVASFVNTFPLKVTKSGSGTGKVTSSPAGIDCGATCEAEFEEGKEVELKQEASPGSEFVKWSGACTGSGTCKVTMSAAKEVTAEFKLVVKPKFKLKTSKAGTGTGTVTSSPAGISCGATCEAEFEDGKEVELKQEASPGSEFKEWTGACSGSGSCKVTMSAAKSVAAKFDPISRTLTVTKAGAGTGTVRCAINAGPEEACSASYPNGTAVKLKATANAGFSFAGFSVGSGSASSCATSPCSFTIEANSSVTATFDLTAKPKFKLTVTKSGSGTGKVTSSPAGIDCGATCEAEFEGGKEVELKQEASPGSEFVKWTGACTGSGTCKVTMSAAKKVTAAFKLIYVPKFKLKVKKTGTGIGKVTCDDTTCASSYSEGTTVTLAATAASASTFAGWSGGGCSGTGNCVVTIEADTTVTATFNAIPTPPPPPSCVVPRLAGKTLREARSALGAAHCALGKVRKPKAKKGKQLGPLVVKSFSPGAGAILPAGSKVDLKLGPRPKKKNHNRHHRRAWSRLSFFSGIF